MVAAGDAEDLEQFLHEVWIRRVRGHVEGFLRLGGQPCAVEEAALSGLRQRIRERKFWQHWARKNLK